ncbi:MAG: thioredoxin fold domain-containing protein, partial [Sedimenticola sp.]
MKKYLLLVAAFLFFSSAGAITTPPKRLISEATDWQAEATDAHSNNLPVMVVFISDSCPYCDRLKSDFLEPLIQDGKLVGLVHINQFHIKSGGKVVDFDGDQVRSRIFVDRYKIYATPTVVLLDYNGNQLTPPIIGFNNADDYKSYLTEAIEDA